MKEATLNDLLSLSIRKKNLTGPDYSNARVTKYLHRTKNFTFRIKDYDVDLRLLDYPVISKLKGSDSEKLELALKGEVKVHCTCPDFGYAGWQYIGTQLDYSTQKENRPPDVRNPNQVGTVCKHVGHIISNISKFKPQMEKFIKKSRDSKYKVVTESTDIKAVIESSKDVSEIITEFTKRKRIRVSDRENAPKNLHHLKFGDVLIVEEEDKSRNHNYNRLLVVRNASNKDHAICYNKDTKKFIAIMNSDIKRLTRGRKAEFDVEGALKLRKEHSSFFSEIEKEPKLHRGWWI